jgi:phosphoserine aminotransferase
VDVLEDVRQEFLDFEGCGMSLIELSHRSASYEAVHRQALSLARSVAQTPDDFEVLFVQGGATLQFSMAPMNLLAPGSRAGYVVSGSWGKKAYANARCHGEAYQAYDGASHGYVRMPEVDEIELMPDTRYVHVTTNETIGGIRMIRYPDTDVPLVADMSSEFLARPIDWNRYDLVYGGVQKNLGPSGMALVYIRRSALDGAVEGLGDYLDYRFHSGSESLGNTPPMFSIYVMGKVLARLADAGGVEGLERASAAKARLVYAVIDESEGFYRNPVDVRDRSHMNVVFRLPSEDLEARFVADAKAAGLTGLKGHRSVGGCRASLYAALEQASVERLAEFMTDFRVAAG